MHDTPRAPIDQNDPGRQESDGERPARAASAGARVLLIEDQPDVARAYRVILSSRGYRVEHVSNARAALDHSLGDIDLILSDIGLPDLDGRELIGRLLARRRIPAIALSGYGTEQDIQASLDAGFTAHLTKPTEMKALLAAVATVLGAGPG